MTTLQSVLQPVLQPALRSVFDPPLRRGSSSLEDQIRALFANGEQGALYYFTPDFAGLYQDAAGTTPVTAVGQPAGLMLDRRFGLALGAEVIPQPLNFSAWSTIGSGEVSGPTSFSTSGSAGGVSLPASQVQGSRYEIDILLSVTEGSVTLPDNGLQVHSGVRTTAAVTASSTRTYLRAAAGASVSVHHFSIRELPGNHASQPTTTARPTLRSGPLRIDYDGVDDYLRTVFPDLGSDVTIARSIPGVGAQILTGQTIAAGNWDDNVTSCATLVIDRSLTGPETALVTAFLNQQAGV